MNQTEAPAPAVGNKAVPAPAVEAIAPDTTTPDAKASNATAPSAPATDQPPTCFDSGRIVFLDYLRFIACFMVMLIHACEPFYLGGKGTLIASRENAIWVTLIDSALRSAVPLFVMASSYLLFPLRKSPTEFFKKRLTRVAAPLVFWCLMYALAPQYGGEWQGFAGLKEAVFNFPGIAGHLWFCYMIIGVYFAMYLLSGWVKSATKREEQVFLGIWLFTTVFPFFRMLQSPAGYLWGEQNWNEFGLFYYVSGFIGYVVLGHYLRTYAQDIPWKKTLLIALPSLLVGYALNTSWFWTKMPKSFPVNEPVSLAVLMEQSWRFCSFGVALMTLGYFLLIKKLTCSGKVYKSLILPVSKVSYGMYLMHIFFLIFWNAKCVAWGMPVLPAILATALLTFVSSAFASLLLSRIPGSKWVIG